VSRLLYIYLHRSIYTNRRLIVYTCGGGITFCTLATFAFSFSFLSFLSLPLSAPFVYLSPYLYLYLHRSLNTRRDYVSRTCGGGMTFCTLATFAFSFSFLSFVSRLLYIYLHRSIYTNRRLIVYTCGGGITFFTLATFAFSFSFLSFLSLPLPAPFVYLSPYLYLYLHRSLNTRRDYVSRTCGGGMTFCTLATLTFSLSFLSFFVSALRFRYI